MVGVIKPGTIKLEQGEIIKSNQYELVVDAEQIVTEAHKILEQAKVEAENLHQQAIDKGYQEGLEKADSKMLERHLEIVNQAVNWLGELEEKIAETLLVALRSTVDDLGKDEITLRMIRKSIEDIKNQPKLRVLTSPVDIDRIQAGLAGHGSNISVTTSSELKSGEAVIESPIGVVKLDLEAQLDQFAQAIKNSQASE